ncbi:hypothetical protein RvY_12378 [Ramazzottius varieornatus]|uniref:CNNM transmembrane domain-containing protein n=1 Tax=Ramazzottius varieornatus TaxID=947166 RepID=A0A1D1VJA9_RAMVA|nr:hypothetical protein RvY_12378 [Ramazzottius varieornatus]
MLNYLLLLILFEVLAVSASNIPFHLRFRRQVNISDERLSSATPKLSGLRIDSDSQHGFGAGIVHIIWEASTAVRIFGLNIAPNTTIKFTTVSANRGDDCASFQTSEVFQVAETSPEQDSGLVHITLHEQHNKQDTHYICVHDPESNLWLHQGRSPYLQILSVRRYLIPLWIQILLVIVLQALSGLFSGLNLGLLSLDPTELQIVASVGAAKEKVHAKNIIPLRKKGNFLLCSLVIGNVLVNSSLTILLDDLTSGLYAVIFSTIGIVLFGEIVPQALCNRFGLAIGSATRYITMIVMGVTCLISYPLSRILDFLLGREIGTVYDRERLVELIRVTKDQNLLENDEINIISGTLSLKRKRVMDIMTPLDDTFMLPYDAILDFDTLAEITREGYTRIPVFEQTRSNVVGLLNIKDLALLDPDDCTAVKTLCRYYSYELCFVFEDTTLDVMLEEFKKGRSHMAFVQHVIQKGDGDPEYETIGVATLEDIIEEMIQSEILDESDKNDLDRKKPMKKDLSVFTSRPLYASLITPQLQHAAFQFLSTSVDPFRSQFVSEHILKRLIRHPEVARMIRRKPGDAEPSFIFQAGRPADYFVLILEGRVEVKIGFEGLVFESGPFTHFGVTSLAVSQDELQALTHTPFPSLARQSQPGVSRLNLERGNGPTGLFVPDFTVYAITDVLFLRIKRCHYIAAIRATKLEDQEKSGQDLFGSEMDRLGRDEEVFEPAVNLASPRSANGLVRILSGSRLPKISIVQPNGELKRSSEDTEALLDGMTTRRRSGGESPLEMKPMGSTHDGTMPSEPSNHFIA